MQGVTNTRPIDHQVMLLALERFGGAGPLYSRATFDNERLRCVAPAGGIEPRTSLISGGLAVKEIKEVWVDALPILLKLAILSSASWPSKCKLLVETYASAYYSYAQKCTISKKLPCSNNVQTSL